MMKNYIRDVIMVLRRENMLSAIIGAFVGGVIGILGTLIGGRVTFLREKRKQERFAATVLYNDLQSIEIYLKNERDPINLRYSENWQNMVSYCSFLTTNEINFIYDIYDEVYNYNYLYKLNEQMGEVKKDDIVSYKNLQRKMFDTSEGYTGVKRNSKKYQELIMDLERQIK